MIDQFDAAQISARLLCGGADFPLIAQHGNARQSLSHCETRGHDSARIFTFGKDDMLRLRSRALSDLIENGHCGGQLSVVSGQLALPAAALAYFESAENLSREASRRKLAAFHVTQLDFDHR